MIKVFFSAIYRQNNVGANINTNGVVETDSISNTVECNLIECAAAGLAVDEERGHAQGITTLQTMSGTIDSTIGFENNKHFLLLTHLYQLHRMIKLVFITNVHNCLIMFTQSLAADLPYVGKG